MKSMIRIAFGLMGVVLAFCGANQVYAQAATGPTVTCDLNTNHYNENCLTYLTANMTTSVGNQTVSGSGGFVSQDHRFWLGIQDDGKIVLYFYPETFDTKSEQSAGALEQRNKNTFAAYGYSSSSDLAGRRESCRLRGINLRQWQGDEESGRLVV